MTDLEKFVNSLTDKQKDELKEIAFQNMLKNSESLTKTLTETKEEKLDRLNNLNEIAKKELFLTNATNALKLWLKKVNVANEEEFKKLVKELLEFVNNKEFSYWLLERVL